MKAVPAEYSQTGHPNRPQPDRSFRQNPARPVIPTEFSQTCHPHRAQPNLSSPQSPAKPAIPTTDPNQTGHPDRVQPNLSSRQSAATRDLLVVFTKGLSELIVDLSQRLEMTVFLFESMLFSVKNTMTVILSGPEGSPANPIRITGPYI